MGLNIENLFYPNALKIYPGFLKNKIWDYYFYADRKTYTIDHILSKYNCPVKFLNKEFVKPDSDFCFCVLKCKKKFSKILIEKVFEELHRANLILGGKEYSQMCDNFFELIKTNTSKI